MSFESIQIHPTASNFTHDPSTIYSSFRQHQFKLNSKAILTPFTSMQNLCKSIRIHSNYSSPSNSNQFHSNPANTNSQSIQNTFNFIQTLVKSIQMHSTLFNFIQSPFKTHSKSNKINEHPCNCIQRH